MNEKDLKVLVETTTGVILASLGFRGPAEHQQVETAFELAYVNGDFGVSVEVNTLDRCVATFIYDATVPERFRPAYRDVYGKIQKRYLTEILATLGLITRKSLQERNQKLRKLASNFDENAKALCDEEAHLLKQWVPHLIPLKDSLFGMTTIDGAPANFYV
jgi:hypothetical protein